MNRVLIIDDEREICESIKMILDFEDYETEYATKPEQGLQLLSAGTFEAVLLDIQMPGMNGFEVLSKIRENNNPVNVIIISAYGSIENAVKATRLGAFDFLEKPIDRDKLIISVRNAVSQTVLKRENETIKRAIAGDVTIVGNSPKVLSILDMIEKVAPTDTRILITGENGTGKELVAKMIHRKSSRSSRPLVEINCAAIPNELIESELFGHEKGAFTGAVQQRIGKFEQANKGTLFLDEIGDMNLQAQAKVLRAIEDGKIERVGGSRKIDVDVRIIAATNKNIPEMISKGEFREDLYHRVNVIPVRVPSLRERPEDIPLLVKHFTVDICNKYGKSVPEFSEEVLSHLKTLKWTGNIRELRNIIERIIILVSKPVIELWDIDYLIPAEKQTVDELIIRSNSFQEFKERTEKAYILKQLELNGWNISKTAELLDIQRSHLYNKMKKYGIEKGE